jgi:hypothetical protein
MGLNLEIDAKIFQLYDLDNKNTVSTANKAHWERELNGKQSSNLLLSRKIKPTVEFLVIVHFNYFWNFRVFSGWTASGRPHFSPAKPLVILRLGATLKHNKREKKAFAQGLDGGTRSRRTP